MTDFTWCVLVACQIILTDSTGRIRI